MACESVPLARSPWESWSAWARALSQCCCDGRLFPLDGVVGVYLATCVVFFVLSRYRIPAIPMFVMIAAAALVWLYDALLERRATIVIALVGLVAAGFVVN